jgi:carboxyvinyl-carboxyphosphonate phosphorylmutase
VNANARRRKFRDILAGSHCISPASVFDAMSARMAEDIGFEAAMLAGSVASMAVLGAPDLVLLTLTELADQARRICRASDIPLLVDADHGYGNALNVIRTVQELEAAGVAALTIEDTDLPEAFGDKARLVSIAEGVGKMSAALAGRSDPDLVIVARTGAAALSSPADAVERMRAYAAAGVDAMFFAGVKTRPQVEAIAAAATLPIILGGGGEDIGDQASLATLGVRVRLIGHQPFVAAVAAAFEALRAQRGEAGAAPPIDPVELIRRAIRADDYERRRRSFLSKAEK